MKKLFIALVCAALLLGLTAPALAEGSRTLTVTGSATISLAADVATMQIGVNTQNASVGEAHAQNAEIMQRVIDAILAQGVAREDVITSEFSVYTTDSGSVLRASTKYTVTNMLYVTVRDLESVAAIIDAATAQGANQMYGLSFSSSQADQAYKKALARAYEDALAKAEALSAVAGAVLGEAESINASGGYGSYGLRNSYEMMDAKAAGAAIVSGDVSVSASVTVTFGLK